MAHLLLSPMLILLLSLALVSGGQEGHHNGDRTVTGVPCPRSSRPWQVALLDGDEMVCAGVLIHKQWVLTVAQCQRREYNVHMGSDLLNDPNAQIIRATESFVHPEFSRAWKANDIMLVKLSRPARLSATVKKIRISSKCTRPGTTCTVSGWGTTTSPMETYPSELICTNVNIISFEECKNYFVYLQKNYTVCGGTFDSNINAHDGDGGEALICRGSLQGLVSQKRLFLFQGLYPVVFTQICKYCPWIYDTMRINRKF